MTLLVSTFAAVISTAVWYKSGTAREMKVGMLCWMFWGASLMWLVDAVFAYAELREAYFVPAAADMVNDLFLGLSAVAFALVIWVVTLLFRDPSGIIRNHLTISC